MPLGAVIFVAVQPSRLLIRCPPGLNGSTLKPLPVRSSDVLASLSNGHCTLATISGRLATFHPAPLHSTGLAALRSSALSSRRLLAAVVVELPSRAHPNVGPVPFLPCSLCSQFIRLILLLVNLRQRLPLFLHGVLDLALLLPLLRAASIHDLRDHLELFLLLRFPHCK